MNKCICIHGHFYQPPRENPWLEAVELQDSAWPYHDWNERVAAQCYAPNAHARLLDGEGRIERIVNNYSRISFNFGPTLLSWMEARADDVHEAIVEADRESQRRFGGHGSALAQCYNHVIMPLACRRDKHTQALWGFRYFERCFGRAPEGMWLPECAADLESLDVLAELGIKFTVLSPFQASRARSLNDEEWHDVNGGRIDPSMPYLVRLQSGRTISVFFYDAPVAQAVAFENLLSDGGRFAGRLLEAFDDGRDHDQLVHIATDGESYGHHFEHGEMALAYALNLIQNNPDVELTIYGEFLEKHPPTHEAEIHQPSAWSCPHGVDRWRRDCGCNSGGHAGWNQGWREPLRNAFDWLRDEIAPRYENDAKKYFVDPWNARNEYIHVIMDRSDESVGQFFEKQGIGSLSEDQRRDALRLLEIQRHAMLMYTSCGWFFDELSGIETTQVMQYAARAIQLADNQDGGEVEKGFLQRLESAKSNIPEDGDGRDIYNRFIKPAIMTLEGVGAHYAISSLFEAYPETARIYSFTAVQEERRLTTAGPARFATGRVRISFDVTRTGEVVSYAALHLGGHSVNCAVRLNGSMEDFGTMTKESHEAFERGDFAEIIRVLDRRFGDTHYTLKYLFRDEQRKILNQILGATHEEVDNTFRVLADRHSQLIRFLEELHVPPPPELRASINFALNISLRREFGRETVDSERVRSLLAEVEAVNAPVEKDALAYTAKSYMDKLADLVNRDRESLELLQRFRVGAQAVRQLPFEVNLWKPQNVYFAIRRDVLPVMRERIADGEENAKHWESEFAILGEAFGFAPPPPPSAPEADDGQVVEMAMAK